MQFSFAPPCLANYSQWAFFEKMFSVEECEKIRLFFENPEIAKTGEHNTPIQNSDIRKSSVCWIPYSKDSAWIYEKISKTIFQCNNVRYGFKLSGFGEPLQLGKYSEGDHYSWHQDNGPGKFSIRKLSVVIQLSKPEDYDGGELQFLGFEDQKVSSGQGDMIVFPSFNPHRVTPVSRGERFSLVSWISGPPFC